MFFHPDKQSRIDHRGQVGDDSLRYGTVLGQVVTGQDADRTSLGGPTSQQTGDQFRRQTADRRVDVGLQSGSVSGDDIAAAIEMPVRPPDVARLRHRDRDHRHFWPTEVIEIGLVIGSGMNRGKRADDLERVAVCTARDQRIQAVLWCEVVGSVWPTPGERRNSPLRGIGSVRGVPGLMGAMKVAQTDVQEPYRRRSVETSQ